MTLNAMLERGLGAVAPRITGEVTAVTGLTIWVEGVVAAIGDIVVLELPQSRLRAEVVGVHGSRMACMPLGVTTGVSPGTRVISTGRPLQVPVGMELKGRVLNGLGEPIDGGAPIDALASVSIDNTAPSPLSRQRIHEQLQLGVRAIDALTPVGHGQRMGIFAGSGVGKSTLLSMIARNTTADVVVVALVGERGREVREFLENDLGTEGLKRSVVVVATSDEPPVVRLRAAFSATRIAEWFRDQGLNVLLFMDSITRTMMAQREVGLSAGEPPATRGYPPSAFALLPRLLERAGPAEFGTITGIYTVLLEGDDVHDPIGDTARSILDGHLVLDRELAHANHYPAIDVLGSISRVAPAVTNAEQRDAIGKVRRIMSAYREAKVLIEVGAYVAGANDDVDTARALMPEINAFLRQAVEDPSDLDDTWQQLFTLVRGL